MAGKTSFALRIAAIPILLALIGIIEARQPLATFRLVTFGAVFLLLADIASLLRDKWCDFLIVLTSLAFGICVIEALANIWEPRELAVVSPDGLYSVRPAIGWGPGHEGRFHADKKDPKTGTPIYSANYTIDSNLLRQTLSCESGPTVVFFGCSFTFGLGLNDSDTLPQAFADSVDRKVRVLNLGFAGYGPQQFLRELQSGIFDSVIGPQPRVFVFLTSALHAERSACKPYWVRYGPRYIIENGQLVLKGACYEGFSLWLRDWFQYSAAYCWLIERYRRRITRDDIEL